jgi:hypothetical protein
MKNECFISKPPHAYHDTVVLLGTQHTWQAAATQLQTAGTDKG